MSEHDEVRKNVAEAYAKALTKAGGSCCSPVPVEIKSAGCCTPAPAQSGGCCGPAPAASDGCCGTSTGPEPQGIITQLAGYGSDDLSALPDDAVTNSFGCGNPLAFSEVEVGDVVVDLGSGAGIDILLAGKKVGPTGKVIGIDMTDEMLERARANISASGLGNVEVRKGVIEELPIESGTVDWVISNCVINLSPEKERVFAEIARVLKPGGRMSVSDIVVDELPEWMRSNQQLYSACVSGAISEAEYLAGLEKAGLEEVEVRDRLVYDADQIRAFMGSDEAHEVLGAAGPEVVDQIIDQVVGKIWSAKVFARKPVG
jgi:arsenite methyltransferase